MILCLFRILTFVKKKVIIPLFSFCIFLFFASFFFPLKRYNRWNFFSFTSAWLSAHSYPPLSALLSDRLSVSYLMLPNLTNQFIKLSDGDLQCEWISDIFCFVLKWFLLFLICIFTNFKSFSLYIALKTNSNIGFWQLTASKISCWPKNTKEFQICKHYVILLPKQ